MERLYVTDQLTAEQTGETIGLPGVVVLRTGHSYGLPIRPGGATSLVPADVHLIEDLYADETVAAILDRIVEEYRDSGSTRRMVFEHGWSQSPSSDGLHEAHVTLPGPSQWQRNAQRWKPSEGHI